MNLETPVFVGVKKANRMWHPGQPSSSCSLCEGKGEAMRWGPPRGKVRAGSPEHGGPWREAVGQPFHTQLRATWTPGEKDRKANFTPGPAVRKWPLNSSQSTGSQHRPRTTHSALTQQKQKASCRCRLASLPFRARSASLGEARPPDSGMTIRNL